MGKWFPRRLPRGSLHSGLRVALYGKVELDSYTGDLLIMHPEFEILSADDSEGEAALHTAASCRFTKRPARSLRESFAVWSTTFFIHRALAGSSAHGYPRAPQVADRWTAIQALHFPESGSDVRLLNAFRSPAQWRLIFEEFFWLECGLSLKRAKARVQAGIAFELNDRVRERIKAMLPFKPTGAQKRVLKEIAEDMQAPHPMSRLLQGDVGSGKTLVAAEAAVIAIENGYQVAVLAPTEILAGQHFINFKNMFQKAGYVVVLLTGSATPREKAQLKKLMAAAWCTSELALTRSSKRMSSGRTRPGHRR